jgi:hypothetical protein
VENTDELGLDAEREIIANRSCEIGRRNLVASCCRRPTEVLPIKYQVDTLLVAQHPSSHFSIGSGLGLRDAAFESIDFPARSIEGVWVTCQSGELVTITRKPLLGRIPVRRDESCHLRIGCSLRGRPLRSIARGWCDFGGVGVGH